MKRHKAAVFAQWRYAHEYETGTSPEDIFETLDPHQKACCRMAVNDILAAPDEDVSKTDFKKECSPSPPGFVKAVDKHFWDLADTDTDEIIY